MIIYLDSDYKCKVEPGEGRRAFNVPFFDNKCRFFVEGYRYVPEGEVWQREDGGSFEGEMLSPCRSFDLLSAAQQVYESVQPELSELRERLEAFRDCLDGLSANPGLEQLIDFINSIRELMEEE